MLECGIYRDSWSDISEAELAENLGATISESGALPETHDGTSLISGEGSPQSSNHGSQHSSNSLFENDPHVHAHVEREIKHRSVQIRRIKEPFDEEHQHALFTRIAERISQRRTPRRFGLLLGELNYTPYQPLQMIAVGQNCNHLHQIKLPQKIWMPRVEQWVASIWELVEMQEELGIA